MLRDHERIAREMSDPGLIRLHRKLERLSSVLTVMNTGAHPDDEKNGLLAALRFGLGMRVVVACSTRGEGGQNAIGTERGAALGVVRTWEMVAAARVLDADVVWLGHGPGDPVHDFGFSKNGDDTLARWGEDRILERLVRAYREERPDIVIPTFLDVPGQHGHHRAMTRAAEAAVMAAADPDAYPHHFDEGLKAWRVAKLYLPAWSGGGSTYDDEVPPPEATLDVNAGPVDMATGAPFARIGEWSRAAHRTQGMGVWLEAPTQTWPLHLRLGRLSHDGKETDIRDGLRACVGSLASLEGMSAAAATHLVHAQHFISSAQAAFPHRGAILEAALHAAEAIENAIGTLPDEMRDAVEHRLRRKLRELDAVILEAHGVHARAWAEPTEVVPGGKAIVSAALMTSDEDAWAKPTAIPALAVSHRLVSRGIHTFDLAVSVDAKLTNPYPACHRALGGNGELALTIGTQIGGRVVHTMVDLEEPLRILPEPQIAIEPRAVIIRLSEIPLSIEAQVLACSASGVPVLVGPEGWHVRTAGDRVFIEPPPDVEAGLYVFDGTWNGAAGFRRSSIAHPHIGRIALFEPETLKILAIDLTLPARTTVGYVSGGSDRVGDWLKAMGLDVTELEPLDLQGDLARFSTIVIGTLAFSTRTELAAASVDLRRYVESGGHLVTLYQKPGDGWDASTTPPRPIDIGSPSVRWRVTNPNAPVTILSADHPLLAGPNVIGDDDWAGWDKERGIYFASDWDDAYVPLMTTGDAGEKGLSGGLISATIGNGRHTHVALVLHHQLDRLVPGAFRLLANLMQPTPSFLGGARD
jgi:LmbE family N-acetylglucosaminyl deacetylase